MNVLWKENELSMAWRKNEGTDEVYKLYILSLRRVTAQSAQTLTNRGIRDSPLFAAALVKRV